jgi:transposase
MILIDELWSKIEDLVPSAEKAANGAGRPAYPRRQVLDGILWVLMSGARWKDLPLEYPGYKTCHRLFQDWQNQGVFEEIFHILSLEKSEKCGEDAKIGYVDGTLVPAKKGDVGRGYKGKGSTVMAICDGTGRPLGFSIHGAGKYETKCVEDVLEAISSANLPTSVFGDKAYDSQGLQFDIDQNWEIVLDAPVRKNSTRVVNDDEETETNRKCRSKVERMFSWIKTFRRTNMRCEYHPENFLSGIYLPASIILFFRF